MVIHSNGVLNYLQIGMKVSGVIEFGPKDEYPIQCSFVGMKEGQFLIFELSAKVMGDLITRKINSTNVIIRGIADTYDGHIIAFKSQILCVKQLASWLMFLRYPRKIESRKIREDRRYKVSLNTHVSIGRRRINTRLVDVSASGYGLCFEEPVELNIGDKIQVESPLKNMPKPYPKCIVANVRKSHDCIYVGVRFDKKIKIDDELRYEILRYVFINQADL